MMFRAVPLLALALFTFSPPFNISWALAEDVSSATHKFLVNVRVIRAEEPIAPEVIDAEANVGQDVVIDSRIDELKQKLTRLPFRSFKLVSAYHDVIGHREKESLKILDGQSLTLRPLRFEDKKLCMWLKWQDSSGVSILDTRVHFELGESMLAGIEGSEDSGVILAIDVTPEGP